MKFPLFIAVVIGIVVLGALTSWIFFRDRSRAHRHEAWVANSGFVRTLPKYRQLQNLSRLALLGVVMLLLGLTLSTAVVAASPVDRRVDNQSVQSRDMIMCLDASGSMLPYDMQIIETFDSIVSGFAGERVSLQLWSGRSWIVFPLTDDYDMVHEVFAEIIDTIDSGNFNMPDSFWVMTPEVERLFRHINDPKIWDIDPNDPDPDTSDIVSSQSGDGLASCVYGFDHTDKERSRTVLFATDNMIQGTPLYTLQEATDLAIEYGVTVTGLYPDLSLSFGEAEEMQEQVERTGGQMYTLGDPSLTDSVVQEIEDEKTAELSTGEVVETDRPEGALSFGGWCLLGLLALAAWMRI